MNSKILIAFALLSLAVVVSAAPQEPDTASVDNAERYYKHKPKFHKKCYFKTIKHPKTCFKCKFVDQKKYICKPKTYFKTKCFKVTSFKKVCKKVHKRYGSHMAVEAEGANIDPSAKWVKCYKKPVHSTKCVKKAFTYKKCIWKIVGKTKKCYKYSCPTFSKKKVCW